MQLLLTNTITTIDELGAVLATFQRPLTTDELMELTSRLQLSASEWREYLAFDPHQFCFRTIYHSPHFEINIIGWRSQQHSSIHDHSGTACCVLVLEGTLTNIDYLAVSDKQLRQTTRIELRSGEILARSGSEIHRCGNDQPSGMDLVTLHLYSPPLRPLSERQYHE